ncbi:hypothetical protein K402DRAFT_419305 [Aulographum hederae CBS 113979]|uniref:Uncharacterized protein n=1 Tax=Aulographum hederae CBS 113979 TaxID=1176131 RepID=A0A6G1H604_9PEZI|nr:hypothetical protein K402DRAFT_419305 [Aulographum hederae CBS 113979]
MALGQTHGNVLTDIASHGYVVIANGNVSSPNVIFSKNTDMFDAALWAAKEGAKHNINTTKLASAGQSCGGMQACTANQDLYHLLLLFLLTNLDFWMNSSLHVSVVVEHLCRSFASS